MKPKNDLLELIQSLSSNERRYHRMRMSLHAGDNNTLLLFDAYCAKNASESSIKGALKDSKLLRNYANLKHLLYQQLMKSLYEYLASKSPKISVAEMIRHSEILLDRGFERQAAAMARKARRLAEKHQLLPQLLDLIDVERQLLENSSTENIIEALQDLTEEHSKRSRELDNINQFAVLRTRLTILRKSTMSGKKLRQGKELQALLQDNLLQDESRALTTSARIIFYRIKAEAAIAMNEYPQGLPAYDRLFELWAEADVPGSDNVKLGTGPGNIPPEYRSDLVNYLNLTSVLQRHEEVETALTKLRKIKPQNIREQRGWFQDVAHIELLHFLQTGKLREGHRLLGQIQAGIEEFGESLSASRVLTLRINAALLCFLAGDYREALQWINQIQDQPDRELRTDIRSFTRLLSLILYFELGEIELFESNVRSMQRHIKLHNMQSGFEACILRHLRQLSKQISAERTSEHFKVFTQEMHLLRNKLGERIPPGFEAAFTWVNSRSNNISISEEFRRALNVSTV